MSFFKVLNIHLNENDCLYFPLKLEHGTQITEEY